MNYYLDRYSFKERILSDSVPEELGIVIVIPCYDEPDLLSSLKSINECESPSCKVEVIVVINSSENSSTLALGQNKKTFEDAKKWLLNKYESGISFHFIVEDNLPKKHAGVGLARKIGMDEAVRRFDIIDNNDGIILCFDADAKCEKNYLLEVEDHFNQYPKSPGCSIHFEHPTKGGEFSEETYIGIVLYELHLRYYKNGLKYCGLPFAYHTIGSSMAVRSWAYQKQNGMNKRKAGEDFYFLNKLIPLGGFSEIKNTCVIPSPRISRRVPFGTGRAMLEWANKEEKSMLTYHPSSFVDLKEFCENVPQLYAHNPVMPKTVRSFLNTIDFDSNLAKIRENSTSKDHFVKLFFNWFNAFKVLKYMHFFRDNFYDNVPVVNAATLLLDLMDEELEVDDSTELLIVYREIDKR